MEIQERKDRVRRSTFPKRLNQRIDERAEARIQAASRESDSAIRERIAKLDRTWDIDRAVMLLLSVGGNVVLEIMRRKRGPRWIHRALRAQLVFLGVYALGGWVPPLPLLRLLGLRTKNEIESEREALKRLITS
jgi:hypothetical protein